MHYSVKVQHNIKIPSRRANVDFDGELSFSLSFACIFYVIFQSALFSTSKKAALKSQQVHQMRLE